MTNTNDLADLREMFVKWDTSNDGHLSVEELRENMNDICSLFNLDTPDAEKLMRAADTNRDGQVDYAEFIAAAFDKEKLINSQNLKRAFRLFDTDGDGHITLDELKAVFTGENYQ